MVYLAFIASGPRRIEAALSCTDSTECMALYHPNSRCVKNSCSNPFSSGCLSNMNTTTAAQNDVHFESVRVCNSDDPPHALEKGLCRLSKFNYTELRINVGNWETTAFYAWVAQILLSELLDVPVSLEIGHGIDSSKPTLNFYDEENSFPYATTAYDYASLREGNRLSDCLSTNDTSVPCSHAIMEVWNGQTSLLASENTAGHIEPAEGNGMVGKLGWYVPSFVIERHPEVSSFWGLQNQREKMASMFKRPYTWEKYCQLLSPTNCSSSFYDGVARRWPETDAERGVYYKSQLYTGHFADTAKNNCTANPTTCSGHIVDAPCSWSTNLEQQAFWNDIYLESDGPNEPNDSYSYGQMIQVLRAANETKSNIIMWWWKPDGLVLEFAGSDAELHPVTLPPASEICVAKRVGPGVNGRCSSDISVRRGTKAGSCDNDHHALKKVVCSRLYSDTYDVSPPRRSPAYDFIKSIQVTDLEMEDMLKHWALRGVDKYGYDGRDAVCTWVRDNLDDLQRFIPRGYPRTLDGRNRYKESYMYAAMAMGIVALIVVFSTTFVTYHQRDTRILRLANVQFLILMLIGFSFVSLGAILFATQPSLVSCTMRQWLVTIGYTLGLVPLVVKVGAINKLVRSARKMKRVVLSRKYLFQVVLSIVTIAIIYLIAWSIVDAPTRTEEWNLSEKDLDFITVNVDCSSRYQFWVYITLAWEFMLCLSACVLSVQARKVAQEFNESHLLFALAFSHFAFLSMRAVTQILSSTGSASVRAAVASFLLSSDVLAAISIYFIPKFIIIAKKKPTALKKVTISGMSGVSGASDFSQGGSEAFQSEAGGRRAVILSEANARAKEIQPAAAPSNSKRQVRWVTGWSKNGQSAPSPRLSLSKTTFPQHHQKKEEDSDESSISCNNDIESSEESSHDTQQSQHELKLERVQDDSQSQVDRIIPGTGSLTQKIKSVAKHDASTQEGGIVALRGDEGNEEEKEELCSSTESSDEQFIYNTNIP